MPNPYEDAAFIFRELKERVDRGEEERRPQGTVNVFRSVTDSSLGADTVTTSVGDAGGWTWDTSKYDFDELE